MRAAARQFCVPRGSDQNPAHHAVQNRLHVVDRIGVPLDDGGEADGADHLDQDEYGLEKLVLGAALGEAAGFQQSGRKKQPHERKADLRAG